MTTETLKRYRRLQAEIDGLGEEIAEPGLKDRIEKKVKEAEV